MNVVRVLAAWVVGLAAIALVVVVAVGVWPHLGTGQLLDPWRGLADTFEQARTWVVTGVAAAVGLVLGLVQVIVTVRRRGRT